MTAPMVSIIVLTMGDPEQLARCLEAVERQRPRSIDYEVIVVCNGATEEVVTFAQRCPGVRLLVSPVNLGFGGGNNHAARAARGDYLAFLNDDAVVQAGWLEPLVETLQRFPRAAAVSSRLLFPDGRLQEAGSVVFADGSTAPVGRGLPHGGTEWAFLRRVDYASAASMLVRKEAFEAVGGFDSRYFPAYYEDTDLCLALQQAGHDILYDGRSVVVHTESTSTNTRFKHFLFRRNLALLQEKWAAELARRLPRPPEEVDGLSVAALEPAIRLARGQLPRVLVVDDMLPLPGLGAGFGRMYDLAIDVGLDRYELELHVTRHPGADPVQVAGLGYRLVGATEGGLPGRPGVAYDAVVLCRPDNAEAFTDLIRVRQPLAKVLYFAEALFWTRLDREAQLHAGSERAPGLAESARMSKDIEQRAARISDRVVCVSPDEAKVLRSIPNSCPVDVVQPLAPGIAPTSTPWAERTDVLYVPSWTARGDTPNEDGFAWFVGEVLPLIVDEVPWTRLLVTGNDPPASFLALRGPHLQFTGFVPDLESIYARAKVVVVPLRFGAGVKNKTVEALQYGVPVVSTTVGAEGIDVHGGASLVVADTPGETAAAVAALLTEPIVWHRQRREIEALQKVWDGETEVRTSWRTALGSLLGSLLHSTGASRTMQS